MSELISWFQIHFSELHEALHDCDHHYSGSLELNPYHLESDCWSHTMMVCKMAEIYDYENVVKVAALLHDIGKPLVRRVNPKNNHIQFFGHEKASAHLAEKILDAMQVDKLIEGEEKGKIIQLVKYHGELFSVSNAEELLKRFDKDLTFCIHLIELAICDAFGRFCTDNSVLEIFHNILDELKLHLQSV